jgi:two-component system, OmpR family, sensor histidine kinase KdpD
MLLESHRVVREISFHLPRQSRLAVPTREYREESLKMGSRISSGASRSRQGTRTKSKNIPDPAMLTDAEKLQKALLNSISHNLRTPLASIIGALSTLQQDQGVGRIDESTRRELIDTAQAEAERLNRLVGNLLDISRLDAGAVRVRNDPCDVQDVIGAALEQLAGTVRNRSIQVSVPSDLPFIRMDFVLIVQVLVNLLDNAQKYSRSEAPIAVDARLSNDLLEISVSDEGDGIPEQELTNVFEKFNRAGRTSETGGIGLGLSICKGLVEAHHGRIWAQRRNPNGAIVTFALPFHE